MLCPHCGKHVFEAYGVDFRELLGPRQKEHWDLLCQGRVVHFHEFPTTAHNSHRTIKEIRKKLLYFKVPLSIYSVREVGFFLQEIPCSKPPNTGLINQRSGDDDPDINRKGAP